jgi:Zn-dependent protease with chaperone function
LQSLLSQLPTTVLNWGLLFWLLQIYLFHNYEVNNYYYAYLFFAIVANLLYIIYSLVVALKALKGVFFYFLVLMHIAACTEKKTFWDFLKMSLLFGGIFFLLFVGIKFLPEKQRDLWFYQDNKSALLSAEQEILLREKIEEIVFQNHQEVKINVIDSAIWVIPTRLEKKIEQSEYDYEIKVMDSPEINAFTIPGGKVFINRGLISFL